MDNMVSSKEDTIVRYLCGTNQHLLCAYQRLLQAIKSGDVLIYYPDREIILNRLYVSCCVSITGLGNFSYIRPWNYFKFEMVDGCVKYFTHPNISPEGEDIY